MTLHAFLPGIDILIFATIALMVFKDRINPTFKFWVHCIGITYGIKLLTGILLLTALSMIPFQVNDNYHYLRFPIWLLLSVFGIRLFTQKILKRLNSVNTTTKPKLPKEN